MYATLTNVDNLLRTTGLSGPTKKVLLTSSIDTVALLGHAASEISILRPEQMKPALKPEYHALSYSETKSSAKFVFGEDLAKQVHNVKETHRSGNMVGLSKGHRRGYPPQKGKDTIKVVPMQDHLFWGSARNQIVGRNYPIRRTTAP